MPNRGGEVVIGASLYSESLTWKFSLGTFSLGTFGLGKFSRAAAKGHMFRQCSRRVQASRHQKMILADRWPATKSDNCGTKNNWKIALFLFARFHGTVCAA